MFPDPRKCGILHAPFGPGCYELRKKEQGVLFGYGRNVAMRMSSLLPKGLGCGTRNNSGKRQYVIENLSEIEYRTLACLSTQEAKNEEQKFKKSDYLFST